jgi:hypothetical protein
MMIEPDPRWDDPDAEVVSFVIRGNEDPEFSLRGDDIPRALRPDLRPSALRPGFNGGHYEIDVEGCTVDFSPEPMGWQVDMLNPTSEAWAFEIAQEILQRMSRVSGQEGQVFRL